MLYDPSKDLDEDQKVLLKARDYIQEHGWCQHQFENAKGEVCLAGAIRKVLGLDTGTMSVFIPLYVDVHSQEHYYFKFLRKLELKTGRSIGNWNDQMGRTKEDVIGVLEHFIWEKKNVV